MQVALDGLGPCEQEIAATEGEQLPVAWGTFANRLTRHGCTHSHRPFVPDPRLWGSRDTDVPSPLQILRPPRMVGLSQNGVVERTRGGLACLPRGIFHVAYVAWDPSCALAHHHVGDVRLNAAQAVCQWGSVG